MKIMRFRTCPELGTRDPLDVLASWPNHAPVVVLHSQAATHQAARWSLIAPAAGYIRASADGHTTFGTLPALPNLGSKASAVEVLTAIDAHRRHEDSHAEMPPFAGWVVSMAYELGAHLEPATQPDARSTPADAPLVIAHWCPDALIHDRIQGVWWQCGHPPIPVGQPAPQPQLHATGPVHSTPSADIWPERVASGIEAIRRGDIFQVNLTRQLEVPVQGTPRTFAMRALQEPQAVFGCLIEPHAEDPDQGIIVSISPELFLHIDHAGCITTRPIKGTLSTEAPWEELRDSTKDAAELHMIVDLMRNDLGRVCPPGTVHVTCPRTIESHPTVHHGVAEVQGQLQPDISLVDLLRATFPAGSITGAPKIRAMQLIHQLEPLPRGIYCGAIGMLGPGQTAALSVAIRTAHLHGSMTNTCWQGVLRYGVGCGIVSDSDPMRELEESHDKARALMMSLQDADTSPPCVSSSGDAACSQSPA